jgi:endonuclease I
MLFLKSYFVFVYSVLLLLLYGPASWAQIPDGYYDGTQGVYGEPLKQLLHNIIKNHNPRTYSQLWQDFELTDQKPNGKVWDMYSDNPDGQPPYEFSFFTDQCGNYSQEGDCYNREHTWPTSWYGGNVMPMYSDLFLVVPTDGFVNMRRGNYPYGEVTNPSWVSANGGKLGQNTTSGYSGVVFEPVDAYKGDFARGMLYMSVRYYEQGNSWPGSAMSVGSELLPWALLLMRQWHEQDPVSDKEIERNNAAYELQGNRNPFIDHPEYAGFIWDESASVDENAWQVFKLYPNPAMEHVTLSFNQSIQPINTWIVLYDVTGRDLYRIPTNGMQTHSIATDQLPAGVYYIHLVEDDNFRSAQKLIKY